ncbi:MAG: nucleotide exchange factor GrpE [Gammaproteobacteria bacterium]
MNQAPDTEQQARNNTHKQTDEQIDLAAEDVLTGDVETAAADSDTGASESTASDDLQQALEAAEAKASEHWNHLLRVQAEMENLRKRTSRDIENAHKFALERFVNELLPVVDSLELGIVNAGDEAGSLREGMELTLKMLRDVLAKFGVVQIDPVGEKFNPELHEAVSMQENGDVASGHVIAVMQKGYSLNERLVRPAMVAVAR